MCRMSSCGFPMVSFRPVLHSMCGSLSSASGADDRATGSVYNDPSVAQRELGDIRPKRGPPDGGDHRHVQRHAGTPVERSASACQNVLSQNGYGHTRTHTHTHSHTQTRTHTHTHSLEQVKCPQALMGASTQGGAMYIQDPNGAAGEVMPTVAHHDILVIAVNTAFTHIASSSTTHSPPRATVNQI